MIVHCWKKRPHMIVIIYTSYWRIWYFDLYNIILFKDCWIFGRLMLLALFGMELRVYCIHVLHFYSMYRLSSYNVTLCCCICFALNKLFSNYLSLFRCLLLSACTSNAARQEVRSQTYSDDFADCNLEDIPCKKNLIWVVLTL